MQVMGFFNATFRVLVSIILVLGIISSVAIYSVSSRVDESSVESVIDDVIDIGAERISIKSEIDYSLLYSDFVERCKNVSSIVLEGEDGQSMIFSCADIKKAGVDGIDELVKEKIASKINQAIETNTGASNILRLKAKANSIFWTIVGVNAVAALIIVFLARWGSIFNLGIVGMVSGTPFFFILMFRNLLESILEKTLPFGVKLSEIQALNNLVYDMVNKLMINYMIVFVIGAVLLGAGLGIRAGIGNQSLSKSELKEGKKRK